MSIQAQNNINLRGKIYKISSYKNRTDFHISCTKYKANGKPIRDKKGLFKRDILKVSFFEESAKMYEEKFKIGDTVIVIAAVQSLKNTENGRVIKSIIYGINMMPGDINNHKKDFNDFSLTGKIKTAKAINDNYIIVNVETICNKKYKNPREETKHPFLTKQFRSITAIGINTKGNAKDLVYTKYTPGTWINIEGTCQGRKDKQGKINVRFISSKDSIVGDIQKWNLKDR